jgi:hypothetical protein
MKSGAHDSSKLVDLCEADDTSIIRSAAQILHGQKLLTEYSTLSFPKHAFPLDENCVRFSSFLP